MIAYNITKARKEKRTIIHKLELRKLSDMALDVVAKYFLNTPELKCLNEGSKIKVNIVNL